MEQALLGPLAAAAMATVYLKTLARTTHYDCPAYGCSFKLSALQFALAPHMTFSRRVTCPQCGARGF